MAPALIVRQSMKRQHTRYAVIGGTDWRRTIALSLGQQAPFRRPTTQHELFWIYPSTQMRQFRRYILGTAIILPLQVRGRLHFGAIATPDMFGPARLRLPLQRSRGFTYPPKIAVRWPT